MTLMVDSNDPTVALFLSEQGAERACGLVRRAYPKTVKKCVVKPRMQRGEMLGYQVIAHHRDPALTAPITNADFERVSVC